MGTPTPDDEQRTRDRYSIIGAVGASVSSVLATITGLEIHRQSLYIAGPACFVLGVTLTIKRWRNYRSRYGRAGTAKP